MSPNIIQSDFPALQKPVEKNGYFLELKRFFEEMKTSLWTDFSANYKDVK